MTREIFAKKLGKSDVGFFIFSRLGLTVLLS